MRLSLGFKTKIWSLPVVATLIFGVGLLIGHADSRHTSNVIDELGHVHYQYGTRLNTLSAEFTAIQDGLKGAIAAGDKEAVAAIGQRNDRVHALLKEVGEIAGKKDAADELTAHFDAYYTSAITAASILLQIKEGDLGEAVTKLQPAVLAMNELLAKRTAEAAHDNEAGIAAAQDALDHGRLISLITACTVVLAMVGASWAMIRNVVGQLGGDPAQAAKVLHRVASGDLTASIELQRGDHASLLWAARSMQERLSGLLSDVRRSAESVGHAAGELAAGNSDLSHRTEHQAESLARTSSNAQQLVARTRENAESARQATALARDASEKAERGGTAVAEIVQTMQQIDEGARSIANIIGLIDGIAFQTNILALNAAVEAARAGEQGKGFAVVASEVRSLAQRSATAAREIADLIRSSTSRVENGSRQVTAAGELIREVVSTTAQVTDVIGRISAASSEQDAGLEELSKTIREADDVTQQNAALVEQATAANASLEQQAKALAEVLDVFKTAAA